MKVASSSAPLGGTRPSSQLPRLSAPMSEPGEMHTVLVRYGLRKPRQVGGCVSRNGLQRGRQWVCLWPPTSCAALGHPVQVAHCTLLSLQQLHVAEQASVTLAGGSRAKREGTSRASGSWLTVAHSWAMAAEKTVSSRGFIYTRLRARSFSYCGSMFDFSQPWPLRSWSVFLVFKPHTSAFALTETCWKLVPQEIWDPWRM